jgi:hypothetical protein
MAEEEEKDIHEELKDLLYKLKDTEPIDEKGNPFSLLPKKDLITIKKHIEELSAELAPNWKGEDHEKAGN